MRAPGLHVRQRRRGPVPTRPLAQFPGPTPGRHHDSVTAVGLREPPARLLGDDVQRERRLSIVVEEHFQPFAPAQLAAGYDRAPAFQEP